MKFGIIDPAAKTLVVRDFETLRDAQRAAGLDKVDHGTIARGLAIVVYEFGFFEPADRTHYFSVTGGLYAGNAVLYGYDEAGETVDVHESMVPPITFFDTVGDIVVAMIRGLVRRPRHSVNNEPPTWQWPQPMPAYMRRE